MVEPINQLPGAQDLHHYCHIAFIVFATIYTSALICWRSGRKRAKSVR